MSKSDDYPFRTGQLTNPDSRRSGRYSFAVLQQMAWVVDGQMPTRTEFQRIQCVDLSRNGFAFHQPKKPTSDELVVALGTEPNFIYFTAKVIHFELAMANGSEVHRVGCQLTGRLSNSLLPERQVVSGRNIVSGRQVVSEQSVVSEKWLEDLEAASLLLSGVVGSTV